MKITVVGVLAIVAAIVAVVLFLRYLESKNDPGPAQNLPNSN
jgi:hypothetical protein